MEIHIRPDDIAASSRQSNFSGHVVRPVELKEIIKATDNFQPAMLIGQGVMFQAFKTWLNEQDLTATKPESGMAVTVKRWYNNLERHQDWLVCIYCRNYSLGHFFCSISSTNDDS